MFLLLCPLLTVSCVKWLWELTHLVWDLWSAWQPGAGRLSAEPVEHMLNITTRLWLPEKHHCVNPLVGPARGNYIPDSFAFATAPCSGIFNTGLKIFFIFCTVELAVSERVEGFSSQRIKWQEYPVHTSFWSFTQIFCTYSIQFNKELHSH